MFERENALRILTDEQEEIVHEQAMRILEEIGTDVLHDEARKLLERSRASRSMATACSGTAVS